MSVEAKVLKQVEFYFSNSNLPNDKFLRELSEKEEGWVAIDIVASFKKMKSLTEDMAVIVAALKTSPTLLEVSEDGTKVKRKEPLPANVDLNPQSIYAKGFPKDFTLEQVTEYFTKILEEGETINSTRLRRMNKEFKGSVFVEFGTEATATRVVALELKSPTPEAQPLLMHMKAIYLDKKKAEWEERKAARKSKRGRDDKNDGKDGEKGESDKKQEPFKRDVHLDCIIKVGDLPDECMREDIKALVEGAGCTVVFVEFNKGNEAGYVRLGSTTEVKATAAVAKMVEEKAAIKDKQPSLLVLEGEEEQAYWNKVFEMQEAKKKGGGNNKKGYKRQRR